MDHTTSPFFDIIQMAQTNKYDLGSLLQEAEEVAIRHYTPMTTLITAIEFYAKNVYGEIKFYVKDDVLAQKITNLTGNKTLTAANMKALKALGFTFHEVIAPR
jgi:hypothetical protein